MARKAGRRHLKRLASTRRVLIERKGLPWVTKPKPGRHVTDESMALLTLLKDTICVADNAREAKKLVKGGEITVDGRKASDEKMAIGFMDVVSIPKTGKTYRIVINRLGRISHAEVKASDAAFKLCRINGKTAVRGGKIQLNLHDSRNILSDGTQKMSTGDVVKISLPDQKILEVYPYKEGSIAFVMRGKHAGTVGKIKALRPGTMARGPLAEIETKDVLIAAPKRNVFIIGEKKQEISIGES